MGRLVPALLALATAAGLAACGGGSGSGAHTTQSLPGNVTTLPHAKTTPAPAPLVIDAALPTKGPDASQGLALQDGMELALGDAGERAGDFAITLREFDDASATRGWNARALAKWLVQRAATDSATIAYLGDLQSGASEVSIPILGAAGIPQVVTGSPDTALGALPSGGAGTREAIPSNDVRLAPSNAYQAQAILHALRRRQGGLPACTKVAVLYGNDPDSTDLATQIKSAAAAYAPMTVLPPVPADPGKAKLDATLAVLRAHGANCAVLADTVAGGAVAVTDGLHEQLAPGARIVGSSGLCTSSWTNPAQGGVPVGLDPDLSCTAPGPGLDQTAAGREFEKEFRATYKVDPPDPAAAYGYEAMTLTLDAIRQLGRDGDDRAGVLAQLRQSFAPTSVIGSIGFIVSGADAGQTINRDYSLYRVAHDGTLEFSGQLRTTAPAS